MGDAFPADHAIAVSVMNLSIALGELQRTGAVERIGRVYVLKRSQLDL